MELTRAFDALGKLNELPGVNHENQAADFIKMPSLISIFQNQLS